MNEKIELFPPAPNRDDLLTDPEKYKRESEAYLAALARLPSQVNDVADEIIGHSAAMRK